MYFISNDKYSIHFYFFELEFRDKIKKHRKVYLKKKKTYYENSVFRICMSSLNQSVHKKYNTS